jgi:hypothetical protein
MSLWVQSPRPSPDSQQPPQNEVFTTESNIINWSRKLPFFGIPEIYRGHFSESLFLPDPLYAYVRHVVYSCDTCTTLNFSFCRRVFMACMKFQGPDSCNDSCRIPGSSTLLLEFTAFNSSLWGLFNFAVRLPSLIFALAWQNMWTECIPASISTNKTTCVFTPWMGDAPRIFVLQRWVS